MAAWDIISVTVILMMSLLGVQSYIAQTIHLHGCQGRRIPMDECQMQGSKMRVESLTIYATPNSTKIGLSNCFSNQDCARTMHNGDDAGITDEFAYLYKWIVHKCEGKRTCDNGVLPNWLQLTGDFSDATTEKCPKMGTKYFTGIHAHISCIAEDLVPTRPPPPDTTPKTPPTTPPGTTSFSVFIPIYLPELVGREKIYLGVFIGLSLVILILLLITIYCCERYRRKRKLNTLLRMLGAPRADLEEYIDDLDECRKPDESWNKFDYNPDCMAEYSGVKPDEYVTLDRRSSEHCRLYNSTETGLYATNSCSTLNRSGYHRDLWNYYGQTNMGFQQEMKVREPSQKSLQKSSLPHVTPLRYDSIENIEMERRMAEALGTPKHPAAAGNSNQNNKREQYVIEYDECSDSDEGSDLLSLSSITVTTGEVSDIDSDHYCHDSEEEEEQVVAEEADNYSNDNRELHVIVEDHAEEELEERISNGSNRQVCNYSRGGSNCWNTGLQWRVEVKYDGICQPKAHNTQSPAEKSEPSIQVVLPTHYKCEVKTSEKESLEIA